MKLLRILSAFVTIQVVLTLPTYLQFHNLLNVQNPFIREDSIVRSDFNEWLSQQRSICFEGIINNIGGISNTLDDKEVAGGAVIASPSKIKPNYFYQWTRDAALTIKSLLFHLDDTSFKDNKLISIVEAYIENNYYLQRLDNKSGKFDDNDRSGLGEPKFLANNKVFDENWGRPQRDGPGLRAIAIMQYLRLLDKYEKSVSNEFLKSPEFIYNEILKPDLEYVVKNWPNEGFDLWEEISDMHYFTSLTQLRALKDGIKFATQYQDYQFLNELQSSFTKLKYYIENESGYKSNVLLHLVESPNHFIQGKRGGLDAAILLGTLHSHNLEDGDYSDIPFDVNDVYLLNTLTALVSDMKYRYPINRNKIGFDRAIGVAIGRYPEDIYDGYGTSEGNPWFISTASAAEIIYKFVYKLNATQQDLIVTRFNIDFYKQFSKDTQVGHVITYDSPKYREVILSLLRYSDSFLEIIKDHVDNQGHMSEQFNKYHGFMQGATDLTWSYSAVWNALRWREKVTKNINIE